MSLDRVRAAVMDQAKAEAARLVADARAEVEKIAAGAQADGDRARASALHEAKIRGERELARELGRVRQEGRMALLTAKNEQMDKAFAEARAQCLAASPDDRVKLAMGWLKVFSPDAGGVLKVNAQDVDAFKAKLAELNAGRAPAAQFTAVEADAGVTAGARIVGAGFTADCTLDRRLEQLRESAVAELAGTLFGK